MINKLTLTFARYHVYTAVWLLFAASCVFAGTGAYLLVDNHLLYGAVLQAGAAGVGFCFAKILAGFARSLTMTRSTIDSMTPQLEKIFESNPQLEEFAKSMGEALTNAMKV